MKRQSVTGFGTGTPASDTAGEAVGGGVGGVVGEGGGGVVGEGVGGAVGEGVGGVVGGDIGDGVESGVGHGAFAGSASTGLTAPSAIGAPSGLASPSGFGSAAGFGSTASRVTVRAVAAAAGLSVATVSRVLNDRDNVATATRRRVQDVVERLGERAPEPRRRSPAQGPRPPVFVRCPYLLTDYFGHIVTSVAETLALHGQEMILDVGDATLKSSVLRSLPARKDARGAVLILPPESRTDLETLAARSYPFVIVDPRITVPRKTVSISAAHFSGARAVTRHLIGLGHRRVGVISGPPYWRARDDRVGGHLAALSEAGLLGDPALMRHGEPAAHTGLAAGGELLDLPAATRPTAIVCFNDKVAVGVLEAAAARGMRVPEDLSVTGFDDIDVSRATTPRLTTVRQPLQEMGRVAVTMLMRQLEGHAHEALSIELATELVVRESTGPAPVPPPASASAPVPASTPVPVPVSTSPSAPTSA